MFTFMERFALVHFFHKDVWTQQLFHFLFQLPVSYLGTLLLISFLLGIQQLERFHLNFLQNKCDLQMTMVALFVMRSCRLLHPPFTL